MKTNYKLWTEEQFDELHDKFVESVKRDNDELEEFKCIIKNIAQRLNQKWKKPYSITIAIIRGVSRCIAGARTKIDGQSFRSKDGEDIEILLC